MAGLRWVRLISQGVVANRQGARPTMTILECYYTIGIGTLTFVYTSEHTFKLFSMRIYHVNIFSSSPLLSSPQLVASSVSFFTHLEEFLHRALTALDLKSFLRFLITVRQGQNHCNVCHTLTDTHTHTQIQKEKQRVRVQERGGGGRHRTDFDTFLADGSDTLSPAFILLSTLPILLSPSFLW